MKKGWYETLVPALLLERLQIDFEAFDRERSVYKPGLLWAPVWVYAVWFQSSPRMDWEVIEPQLGKAKGNIVEQQMVCGELAISGNAPPSARRAARNYVNIIRGEPAEEEDNE